MLEMIVGLERIVMCQGVSVERGAVRVAMDLVRQQREKPVEEVRFMKAVKSKASNVICNLSNYM